MGSVTYNEENLQTIIAKNFEEAKKKLYDDYGYDYDIVNRRSVPRSYFFGLFSRDMIEVSYTIKDKKPQPAPVVEKSFASNKQDFLKTLGISSESVLVNAQMKDVSKELREIKEQLADVSKIGGAKTLEEHPTIKKVQELLAENEFTFGYIQELIKKVRKTFPIDELDDDQKVQEAVVDWIGENITIAKDKTFKRPHVVVIIGPTGVGKTTTLTKIATAYMLDSKKAGKDVDFCFITTDTMRVGAMEQIVKVGEIVSKDVMKAQNSEDVEELFNNYKDKMDTIFIDTAGYGPNDAEHIGAMKKILSVKGVTPDIYLAVTASTKAKDLKNIMQNYEPFGYRSVIITKCDESQQIGNVLSVLHEKHKDVSYITYGQSFTKTISKISKVDMLMKLEGFDLNKTHIIEKFGADNNSESVDAQEEYANESAGE